MIDTSWSSIRVLMIMILGILWVYVLNEHINSED